MIRLFITILRFSTACMAAALFLSVPVKAQTDFVADYLTAFEEKNDYASANKFFAFLYQDKFTDDKIEFQKSASTDTLCQQVWYWAAEYYYSQQQYNKAEEFGLKALPLFADGNNSKADCLNLMGLIYVRKGDFASAADYALQCLKLDIKSGDDNCIASSMNTMAGIYMAGYQAKEAERYILGAIKHINRTDNLARKAVILGMASEIYHTLGDDHKALSYAEQAFSIDSTLGRKPQSNIRLSQQASALLGLHRYSEAEHTLRKVIPAMHETGDTHSMAIALNRLGMALLCQKRQNEAIPYYKEAAGLFAKMGDLYNEIHSHRGLYECYWELHPDSAKIELDLFDLLKDSLYKHSSAEALSHYNAEFNNNLLQNSIEEERIAHRRTLLGGIAVLLCGLFGGWFLVRRIRRKNQRQTKALLMEIEKLRCQADNTSGPTHSVLECDTSEHSPEMSAFLLNVITIVNESLPTGHYSVEDIASKLNISVQTFRRRIQTEVGQTPKAFITAIQMELADKLLTQSTEMSIQDVARQCGFDETSTFSHTFRRTYGVSPSKYRKQNMGQPPKQVIL